MPHQKRLFCEISPMTYKISLGKEVLKRHLQNLFSSKKLAKTKNAEKLPVLIQSHKSLVRRRLHNADQILQENKAVNLALSAPKVTHILIQPGETFSFWNLVGKQTAGKGYRPGLIIKNRRTDSGIGGGTCQFTNLVHWMVLHTDLEITEHHHHNQLDLFPDFKRQIPFGTGTSVMYNYLDYRFRNPTDKTYQLMVWVDDEYLCGEIRSTRPLDIKVHIREEAAHFYFKDDDLFRHNKIYRKVIDKTTGDTIEDKMILENNSQVAYDISLVDPDLIKRD